MKLTVRYKYSTCYRDNPEIVYYDEIISSIDVFRLVESFEWAKELQKEEEHYAPSLEFINIEDKHCLILSGIGKDELENFQVAFIIPGKKNINLKGFEEEKFWNNWSDYHKGDKYCDAVFNIEESGKLLKLYLEKKYLNVKSQVESRSDDTIIKSTESQTRPEFRRDFITKFIDNHLWFMNHIVIRFLGILVASFFSMITYSMISTFEKFNVILLIFGGLSVVFVTGVVLHEIKLLKDK